MADIIQIILLIVIAWFIIAPKNQLFADLLNKQRKIILDSCALIDGRIVEVVNTRFLSDELVIPQFIINELQMLADGSDSHKRERARFGLDIAHQLQDMPTATVTIDRSIFPEIKTNDDKLIALAKRTNALLCTTDYNLGKVAALESLHVLNINELAQSLRPVALPGETLNIKIIQKGSNRDQGVGYLDDGTMIVVDNAARYINKVMPVTVTRMHQTVAGKMVFGQIREDKKASDRQPHSHLAAGTATSDKPLKPAAQVSLTKQHQTPQEQLHSRLQKVRRRRPLV